ncbi:MAG TPA: O-antigen ligase family protein, partial [Solirubrobacterales bacterium]|nr:O-antigen ligase family protein [Solirubrobacterales bacterium]
MTLRIGPSELLARTGFFGLAAMIGLLAGYDPQVAVAMAAAIAFLVITFADLRIGLALFVVAIFMETTAIVPGLGIAKVAGGALALSWLARIITDPDSRRLIWIDYPGLTALAVAFLAWSTISAVWSPLPGAAIDSSFRYLLSVAMLPIVYTAVRSPADMRMVIVAFVAGASLTALMGVASPPSSDGDLGRIASTIGDPNELAATLAAGFVLAIGASFGAPPASLSRLLLRVAAGLCLLAIVLTLSRGGLVAVAAVGVIAPLLAKHRARATAISLSCLAAAALGFLAFAPAEAVERIQSRDGGSGRTDIWKVAGRMIEDKPVIGIGSGNFPTSSSDYVLQPGALPDKPDLIYKPSVAHNIYLEVWSEVGLVGLLLFGGVIFGCLGCC